MDEGAALEKRYTFARIAGSNPALSAITLPLFLRRQEPTAYPDFTPITDTNTLPLSRLTLNSPSLHTLWPMPSLGIGRIFPNLERCQSGRMGAPGERVGWATGLAGSNPALSAITHMSF